MTDLNQQAEELVRTRIPGSRKGADEPADIQSLRFSDTLSRHGFSDEVCLAGLLHDIVEDGEISFDQLAAIFPQRVVDLVRLCSHDDSIEGGDARWIKMMSHLIDARDAEAWSIKAADLLDNLKSSHTMTEDRRDFMRQAKAPFFLKLSWHVIGETPIWKELQETLRSLP